MKIEINFVESICTSIANCKAKKKANTQNLVTLTNEANEQASCVTNGFYIFILAFSLLFPLSHSREYSLDNFADNPCSFDFKPLSKFFTRRDSIF